MAERVVIGLYGTLSYRISRRTTEIGVRIALGAQRRQILAMVLRQSLRITAFGIAIGIPAALITGHFMDSMLFGLEPTDTASLLAALAGILAVGLSAVYIPAHRLASVDLIQALRSE